MKTNLKLVTRTVEKKERLIVGVIYSIRPERTGIRRYMCLENAIKALTVWLLRDGAVGDKCIIHHHITGLEIGTLKRTTRGRIVTDFIWDEQK